MAPSSQEVDLEPESDEDPGEESLCPLIGLKAGGIVAESHEVEENALEKKLFGAIGSGHAARSHRTKLSTSVFGEDVCSE